MDIGIITTNKIYSEYTGDSISGIFDNAGKVRQYLSDSYFFGTAWALLAGDHDRYPFAMVLAIIVD